MTATASFNAMLARDYIIGLLLVPAVKGDVQSVRPIHSN